MIYVRAAYEETHAELNRHLKQQYVVIGNPGIGKSCFVLYVLLHKALQDKTCAVLQHQRTNTIYYFEPLKSKAYEVNSRRACDYLKSISPIYLHDMCYTDTRIYFALHKCGGIFLTKLQQLCRRTEGWCFKNIYACMVDRGN